MKTYLGIIKLVSLFVFLPLFLWVAVLSKTGKQYKEYRKLSITQADMPVRSTSLQLPAEKILSGEAFVGELDAMSSREGFTIVNYIPSFLKSEAGVSLYSAKLQAKGRFIPLLKLVHFLEEKKGMRLSSLSFLRRNENEDVVTLEMELIQLVKDEEGRR